MQPHEIRIPGLDRQLCGKCRKWICRPCEIARLQKELDKAGSKRIYELQKELDKEKWLMDNCINPK